MRILLLGANGQVGWELRRTLSALGELLTTARDRSGDLQIDTADLATLAATLDSVSPDVIVNATAYTAVDKAESEPELAMRLNGDVPGLIGEWAAAHDALVVHYSTDYVFDGRKRAPYSESDATNPISVYGRSKLAGDEALLRSSCKVVILRVSWIYGLRGSNFLLTMKRLMHERDALGVVDDQIGAPTWCRTVAQVTAILLAKIPRADDARQALSGIYHLSPHGSTSWFGFASAIHDRLSLNCALNPIATSAYPTAAARPANSQLDATKLERTFDLLLPTWEQDLGLCLADSTP